jgi:dCMP deaminase
MSARTDHLTWDEFFISLAFLSAMRSKDPSTQVGACIVDKEQRVLSIGYNGFPNGCSDDKLPWARTSDQGELFTKYPYVCHAEMNAIMNKNSASTKGCKMYVALFPCNECAKLIIQAGIIEVIYVSDKYHDSNPFIASRKLLELAGVATRQFIPTKKEIRISFEL